MKAVLLGVLALLASAWVARVRADTFEAKTVDLAGVSYLHVSCSANELDLAWRGTSGEILRTFPAVAEHLRQQGREARFLMNGGIFEPGGIPSGLLVCVGKEERPINLMNGNGNFYLKPNGVFYVDASGAAVLESREYAQEKPSARLAVQSGPLLLRRGAIHPAFNRDSLSRLHRNGVGVDQAGRIHFLITDPAKKAVVNLHGFARAFRSLGCADALFLDGDISQCFVAEMPGAKLASNRFASIFTVSASKK